ncbi:hypothetical protein C484_00685 [Natrialba taiwanensis DSM 12281]|uniref:Uncharacterized protein n=1 Tax=Natrialba taiwanensis DSM 12281 TaxID=1230458 RepID=M0AE20_9EURY|nr:hypothetical protein C484_00685 [Natrialba taiwanensis DSM 12281]
MASRGHNGADVLKLTSKSKLKDRLGRSPDLLDAAYMAVWARDSGAMAGIPTATASFGGDDGDAAYMAVWARDSGAMAGIPTATASFGGDDGDEVPSDSREFKQSEVGGAIHEALNQQRGRR